LETGTRRVCYVRAFAREQARGQLSNICCACGRNWSCDLRFSPSHSFYRVGDKLYCMAQVHSGQQTSKHSPSHI